MFGNFLLLFILVQNSASPVPTILHEDIRLVRRLDGGKFSDVFEGYLNSALSSCRPQLVALKVFKQGVSIDKINREVTIMTEVQSTINNTCTLLGVCRTGNNEVTTLVMQHAAQNKTRKIQYFSNKGGFVSSKHKTRTPPLTMPEIRFALFELLKILDAMHEKHIMHRDVKPRNILLSRSVGGGRISGICLCDFGLSDWYEIDRATGYSFRVATKSYKAPELITGSLANGRAVPTHRPPYGPPVDMWGVGCILAALLFEKEPFFGGKTLVDVKNEVEGLLGPIDCETEKEQHGDGQQTKTWENLANSRNKDIPRTALDLATKLLRINPKHRLTAREAMEHEFFLNV